ncbi:MAG: tandem-95 repeat protein, partial [Planctomycetales bacterium]|nr:tandem-95 repeat protein [Planctomycetales bacterium]
VNSTPNTFVIAENSPIGTSVGFVDTTGLGDTVILDFDQPNLREELQLVPDDHLNGDAASPVVLIEYLDLQCPICRTYHPIIRDLEEEFEGELLVVSRHFPLEASHPNALDAARAAEAADRQGRFDDYVDLLYENQDDWADEADPQSFFEEYAADLGLNLTTFLQDMDDPAVLERIRRDQEVAPQIGATGTPTFFLQGEQLTDLPNDLNEFESLIEDELDLVTRPFSLDRRTGEISVRSATQLDFETNPSFTLDLIVTNLNGVVSPVEVTILLTNVSEVAPVANADAYTLVQDTTLQINATNGVLANDSDEEDDPLTAELVTSPANGTLTLNDDGSFTYTPNAGFVGSDSFTYRATDGVFDSNAVTVSLAVTLDQGNVAPTAVNDAYVVNQGNVLTVAAADGVLRNDSDTDGDSLTAFIFTAPANGTVSLNQDGSFTYTPVSGFSGTDSFTYRANDGNLNSTAAIVAITVNPVNNRPTSEADRYEVDEDGQLDVDNVNGLLANDADADGDTLTAQLLDGPSNGSLTLNQNGSFTYTPAAGFVGTETFTYRASDGQLLSDTTTVTIVVNPQNDTPVAVDDTYETNEDSPLNVDAVSGLLLNDSDADSDTLTVTVISQPTNGTVVLEETGAFVYTPAANFFGFDSFTYAANDGTADSNVATVTIEVIGLDDAPVAEDDLFTIGVDETLTLAAEIGVLANDVDADGDTLTVTLVTDVESGTLTLSPDGSLVYEPTSGFQGSVSFEYQVSDGAQSSIGTATIIVNNRPVAQDDQYQVDEEQTLTVTADVGVLANDADANSDPLTAVLRSAPSNGSVTLNSDGSFEYLPNANFAGTDSFTYVANDNLSDSEVATVTIEVANMNDSPVANNDSYSANINTELTINAVSGVLANDTDMENDSLTVSLVANVSNGSLTLNADGSFSYLPNTDFVGTDTFTYMANDGQADSEIATVTITVADSAVQLTAADDFYSVAVDGVLDVSEATGVLANDSHSGNQPFVAALITTVANGTLVFNTNGAFDYSPNTGFRGTDSFTYAITDGVNASTEGTVTITVNSAPDAQADAYSTLPGQQLSVDASQGILANDSDADGDSLTITVINSTANGVLDASADGSFSYTPDGGFIGTDSFTYTVSDGLATTDEITVTIVVSSGNTPPTAVEDSYGVEFNGELNVFAAQGVLANDA